MNQRLVEDMRELYKIQREIDKLNREKTQIKRDITDQIIDSRMEGRKFTVGDRKLSYCQRTVTQHVNIKYLKDCIYDYFEGDLDEANRLIDHIMANRERKQRYELEFVKNYSRGR